MRDFMWCVVLSMAACGSSPDPVAVRDAERAWANLQWCMFGDAVPAEAQVAPQIQAQLANIHSFGDMWPKGCAPYASALSIQSGRAGLGSIGDAALNLQPWLKAWPDVEALAKTWSALASVAYETLEEAPATRVPSPPPARRPLVVWEGVLPWSGASEQRDAEQIAAGLMRDGVTGDTKRLELQPLRIPGNRLVTLRPGYSQDEVSIAVIDEIATAWSGPYDGVFLLRTRSSYEPAEPVLVIEPPPCTAVCTPTIGLAAAGNDVVVTVDREGKRRAARVTAKGDGEAVFR